MTELKLGAATVQRIEESYEPNFDAKMFFPDWQPSVVQQHKDWLLPHHYDEPTGFLKLGVHSWLLTIGGKRILIDTCVGNHKSRPHRPKWHLMETPYLARLKAAGVEPDQVDMVMCTHLHVDHVGWNTRLENGRWVPTFPKARYLFAKGEFDYWTEQNAKTEVPPFADSVLPVVEAKRAQIVTNDFALGDHGRILPTPGHTPGHVAFTFGKARDDVVIAGDLMHTPLQTHYPELSPKFDVDPKQAAVTRRSFLERFC